MDVLQQGVLGARREAGEASSGHGVPQACSSTEAAQVFVGVAPSLPFVVEE